MDKEQGKGELLDPVHRYMINEIPLFRICTQFDLFQNLDLLPLGSLMDLPAIMALRVVSSLNDRYLDYFPFDRGGLLWLNIRP